MRSRLLLVVLVVTVGTIGWWANTSRQGSELAEEARVDASITPGLDLGGAAARRFEANELQIGDVFPGVDIFDARGNPINTSSLKGQYTVLVSGCLT